MAQNVLIVGTGQGLSAAIARRFASAGAKVALASRKPEKLRSLAAETRGIALSCDASDPASVSKLFADVQGQLGEPDVVIYNASGRVRGSLIDLKPSEVEESLRVTAFGGFLVGQAAAKCMIPRGQGVILFTGASASVKGYPQSAPFAMGKFALRGLAQSMARELAPQGVHIGHVVIDGAIRPVGGSSDPSRPDAQLDPDAIADTYYHLAQQSRSAWTWEVEVRPWIERF